MFTFDPLAGFRDVSEYTFAGPGRRLTVRATGEVGTPEDLVRVAGEYAARQADLFAARADVSGLQARADGTSYVVVTTAAARPPDRAAVERSAFLLFRAGVAAHLSLTAAPGDGGAEAEFRRLVEAVRPAAAEAAGPRAVGATGGAGRQAGPVWLDLPATYRDVTVPVFHDAATGRRLTVSLVAAADPTRAAGSPLFVALEQAEDDRGRVFAFEAGPDPWAERTGGADGLRAAAEAGPAAATRDIDGRRVVVQVQSAGPDPDGRELAERVARSVRPSP